MKMKSKELTEGDIIRAGEIVREIEELEKELKQIYGEVQVEGEDVN